MPIEAHLTPVTAWIIEEARGIAGLTRPREPTPPTLAAVGEYARGPFTTWMTARLDATAAFRSRVDDGLRTSHDAEERALSAALLGFLYEDLAREYFAMPVPQEIETDEDLQVTYWGAIIRAASPLLDAGRSYYQTCQREAQGASRSQLQALERYCLGGDQALASLMSSWTTD